MQRSLAIPTRCASLRVLDQVPVFAVDRDEEARPHQVEHQLQLLLAGVTGDVHLGDLLVNDLRTAPVEVVDQIGDGLLVAGNETGRENHRVAPFQLDLLVVVHGDPRERRHRLPLGTGGDHADLLLRQPGELLQLEQQLVGDAQIAELPGNPDVGEHGAPVQEHLAAAAGGCLNHLLHPVDVAGEGRDDDPPRAFGKDIVKGVPHELFREGVPLPFNIGGVGHERQHPLLAVAGEGDQVGQLAVHRGLVEFEIAGMDHHPLGGADRQPAAVDDGVGDPKELHLEDAGRHLIPRLHHPQVRALVQVVLFELFPDKTEGERRAVDGGSEVREHEGEGADMVLVAVGEEDPAHPVGPFEQVGDVGDDQVDAEHVRLGEHEAAIDDDDVLAVLENGHVQADLPQPAKGDDLQAGMFGDFSCHIPGSVTVL